VRLVRAAGTCGAESAPNRCRRRIGTESLPAPIRCRFGGVDDLDAAVPGTRSVEDRRIRCLEALRPAATNRCRFVALWADGANLVGRWSPSPERAAGPEDAVIPFVTEYEARYGEAEAVSPLIRRVLAENPSKFTFKGTGTYLVGHGRVAVIDPGPDLSSHREALERALAGEEVTHILVTHCHADHSPLATWLAAQTGAPTVAFGAHESLHPEIAPPAKATEEAIDTAFVPDMAVTDGDVVESDGWTLEAVHTPGHTGNHTCFALREERALFSGDHVMGWSTSVVGPPGGDVADYLASLRKVRDRHDEVLWPTHGPPVRDPRPFVNAYLEHRLERERQVLACLGEGMEEIPTMVAVLYADVRPELHEPAGWALLGHLVKLVEEGRVVVLDGPLGIDARFALDAA
jgi:glyoxylase-like metal-dependent hydrolase (beta-lactamase superfamily II)